MICFAKGVKSGTVPMGGVIARKGIYDAFMKGPDHAIELFHGYTYSAHPLACAAGLATLSLYGDEKLFENARALEETFADAVHGAEGPAERASTSAPSGSPAPSTSRPTPTARASAASRPWTTSSIARTRSSASPATRSSCPRR